MPLWADKWDHVPVASYFLSRSASQLFGTSDSGTCPCLPPCLLPSRALLLLPIILLYKNKKMKSLRFLPWLMVLLPLNRESPAAANATAPVLLLQLPSKTAASQKRITPVKITAFISST